MIIFCYLIVLEQWYFNLIWNTYMHVKITNLLRVVLHKQMIA